MTEPFRLTPRTPAGKIRYAVEQLNGVHAQDSAGQTKLIAVRLVLDRLADELDSGTIPATPICGDVFQSGITDRAQGPCLKPPGHAPADPWHQDNTGCRWRLAEDAPLRTPATPEATALPTQATGEQP